MRFLTKLLCTVRIGIAFKKKVLHLTKCLVDTGTEPNSGDEDYLKPQLKWRIRRFESPELGTATKKLIKIEGVITLVVHMEDLQVQAWFRIVKNLPVKALIGTTYINKCIQLIFLIERKIIPEHSALVEILEEVLRLMRPLYCCMKHLWISRTNAPQFEEPSS